MLRIVKIRNIIDKKLTLWALKSRESTRPESIAYAAALRGLQFLPYNSAPHSSSSTDGEFVGRITKTAVIRSRFNTIGCDKIGSTTKVLSPPFSTPSTHSKKLLTI